jgi:hypothetical protein
MNTFNEKEEQCRNTENKLKLSLIPEDIFNELRFRSHSMGMPNIDHLAYCLDFVPKLKYFLL